MYIYQENVRHFLEDLRSNFSKSFQYFWRQDHSKKLFFTKPSLKLCTQCVCSYQQCCKNTYKIFAELIMATQSQSAHSHHLMHIHYPSCLIHIHKVKARRFQRLMVRYDGGTRRERREIFFSIIWKGFAVYLQGLRLNACVTCNVQRLISAPGLFPCR